MGKTCINILKKYTKRRWGTNNVVIGHKSRNKKSWHHVDGHVTGV